MIGKPTARNSTPAGIAATARKIPIAPSALTRENLRLVAQKLNRMQVDFAAIRGGASSFGWSVARSVAGQVGVPLAVLENPNSYHTSNGGDGNSMSGSFKRHSARKASCSLVLNRRPLYALFTVSGLTCIDTLLFMVYANLFGVYMRHHARLGADMVHILLG